MITKYILDLKNQETRDEAMKMLYSFTSTLKEKIALYLWTGLFLFPFSFYSKSAIEDKHLKNLCNKILIARIYLLSIQFVNFILSLILKINI